MNWEKSETAPTLHRREQSRTRGTTDAGATDSKVLGLIVTTSALGGLREASRDVALREPHTCEQPGSNNHVNLPQSPKQVEYSSGAESNTAEHARHTSALEGGSATAADRTGRPPSRLSVTPRAAHNVLGVVSIASIKAAPRKLAECSERRKSTIDAETSFFSKSLFSSPRSEG